MAYLPHVVQFLPTKSPFTRILAWIIEGSIVSVVPELPCMTEDKLNLALNYFLMGITLYLNVKYLENVEHLE